MQLWELLGSVFGLKSEMVERQEMRGGEGRQWVHTRHTRSLTARQVTLGTSEPAAVRPPHWSAALSPGLWLAADRGVWRVFCSAYPGTGTRSSLHLVSLNPSPGADQANKWPTLRRQTQSYSGLLTATSALIVVTGLQTVIDWMHPGNILCNDLRAALPVT